MKGSLEMELVRQRREELWCEAQRSRLARRARRRRASLRRSVGSGLESVGDLFVRAGRSLQQT